MLTGSASATNVKRSIDKYIYDNLDVAQGLEVDYEGLPFEDTEVTEWIQPRILSMLPIYRANGPDSTYAEELNILLQFSIFVKKSSRTVSDRCWRLRDLIDRYFRMRTDINLRDYIAGSSLVDTMRVREIVTDIPLPETGELYQYALAYELDYTRETTKP